MTEPVIRKGFLARESLGSTAIGEGIAIPHAKVEAVKEPGLAAITVPEGVDYEAFDGSLSNLIFIDRSSGRRRRRTSGGIIPAFHPADESWF